MTVLEAIKQTVEIVIGDATIELTHQNGGIDIPIGGIQNEENVVGTVSEDYIVSKFGNQLNLNLPLTQEQFSTLKNTVEGLWADNWQWYKDNNIITVI